MAKNKKFTNNKNRSVTISADECSSTTNTGHCSISANTGDRSLSVNYGFYSISANTGDYSLSSITNDYSSAISTGDCAISMNSGYCTASLSNGNLSVSYAKTKNSIAASIGYGGIAKGVLGSYLLLANWENDYDKFYKKEANIEPKLFEVDGKTVKENTWYTLYNGELIEVKKMGFIDYKNLSISDYDTAEEYINYIDTIILGSEK